MTRPLRVFLCHASQDKPAVRELYSALKNEGWIDPWLDKAKILPGQDWEMIIEKAVDDSDVVITCLSSHSVTKEGFVQREIRYAYDMALEKPDETIFLIPLRLDDCIVPRKLRTLHWVDYFGLEKKNSYSDLLEALRLRYEQKTRFATGELVRKQEEQEKREAVEKAAREKLELEVVENAVREKLKRESAKIAKLERLEREAKVKSKREKLEREKTEKVARQSSPVPEIKKLEDRIVFTPLKEEVEEPKKGISTHFFSIPLKEKQQDVKLKQQKPLTEVLAPSSLFSERTLGSKNLKQGNTLISNAVFKRWLGFIGLVGFLIITPLYFLLGEKDSLNYLLTTTPILATNAPPINPDIGNTWDQVIDGMTMVFIPAGEFTMGSDIVDSNEKPVHTVYLDAFWIDKTEVTNAQYVKCVTANKCNEPVDKNSYTRSSYFDNSEFDNYPVINVSWHQARIYCKWVGRRLPTEAEWEKAARGTDARKFPWGNDAPNSDLLNYNFNVGDTTEVGKYPNGKSIYGAADMAGNVLEWTSSLYRLYPYDADDGRESLISFDARVIRGGAWNSNEDSTYFYRGAAIPSNPSDLIGFRCARSP